HVDPVATGGLLEHRHDAVDVLGRDAAGIADEPVAAGVSPRPPERSKSQSTEVSAGNWLARVCAMPRAFPQPLRK
ncbi:hypothetical protein, partial [Bradyrhizobium sp. Mp27]|uniref:hypothetical protein n=1 Tax=Bradyrhizobium sp. Mp27 TaxID=3042157 RepID=UPI00248B024C